MEQMVSLKELLKFIDSEIDILSERVNIVKSQSERSLHEDWLKLYLTYSDRLSELKKLRDMIVARFS